MTKLELKQKLIKAIDSIDISDNAYLTIHNLNISFQKETKTFTLDLDINDNIEVFKDVCFNNGWQCDMDYAACNQRGYCNGDC